MTDTIAIEAGGWQAAVAPALGGAILSLRQGGVDVMRPTPAGAADALETACFALVPYANRIAFGRFRQGEREIALPRNFGDHPHSLHGVGWQTTWAVAEQDAASMTLVHHHAGGAAWPWRYRATQRVTLDPQGLTAMIELRNEDQQAMPASLGFHPYFPADAATLLRFVAAETWASDATQLPTHAEPGGLLDAWAHGAPAKRADLVDHCHAGWSGTATVAGLGRKTRVTATGADFLHVHSPPGKPFVGVEPVSAMPDAVNRPEPPEHTGLRLLAPGETMTLAMRVESAPLG